MLEESKVWVVVETEEVVREYEIAGERSGAEIGGGFGSLKLIDTDTTKQLIKKRIPLDVKLLKNQMSGLLTIVNDLFKQAEQQPGMQLEELELSVEIDGEGQVSLVGNGAKFSSGGGIKMKFTNK